MGRRSRASRCRPSRCRIEGPILRLDKGSGAGVMLEHPRNIGGIFPDRVEWEKGGVGGPGREERVLKPLERGSAQLRLITRAGVEMYQRPAVRSFFFFLVPEAQRPSASPSREASQI